MSKKDLAKIKAFNREYIAICNADDIAAFGNMWTKNAVWMPADAPRLAGRKAIAAFAKTQFFDPFKIKFTQTLKVKVAGSQAFGSGTFRIELTAKSDGSTAKRTGKFMAVLEKEKDGWKFAQGIFNYDSPLA